MCSYHGNNCHINLKHLVVKHLEPLWILVNLHVKKSNKHPQIYVCIATCVSTIYNLL